MSRILDILDRMKRSVKVLSGIGGTVGLMALLSACPSSNVTLTAPLRAASQLDPLHRLSFERVTPISKAGGENLVNHEVFSDPTILFEDGKYRMWFTVASKPHSDQQEMGVAYAESEDGIVWNPRVDPSTGEPELLLRPTPGGWDSGGVETPNVVRGPDGRYFLFYSGDVPPRGSHSWAIGLAVSDDGFTWTKVRDTPILEGQGGWEGPFFEGSGRGRKRIGGVNEPSVIYDADQQIFRMWYSALGEKSSAIGFRIGYATSTDGIEWQRQPDPVFEPDASGSWDDAVVSHTNVVYQPGQGYHLFYFGTSAENYRRGEESGATMMPGSIGHAFSRDGLQWERDSNPVLSIIPETWEAWTLGGPTALVQGDEVKLWYFATAVHNKWNFRIGLAKAKLSAEPTENSTSRPKTVR